MAWDKLKPTADRDFLLAVGDIRANNTALEVVLTAARLAAGTEIPDLFPIYNKTPMLFYMAAAPSGWTETANVGDALIAIKGGSTYIKGGEVKGSWAIPEHVLTIAKIPAHTHTHTKPNAPTASRRTAYQLILDSVTAGTATSSVGGGKGHSEGSTFRPAGRITIMASKD